MSLTRRALLQSGLALATLPLGVRAAPKARVIVIGAGFGGATCAKYLRRLSPGTEVILIERRPQFFTGPFTNLVVTGYAAPKDIMRRAQTIAAAHGVRLIADEVRECDPVKLSVRTAHGRQLSADRIVISPGIAMRWDLIEGLNAKTSAAMPHAWLGDGQVLDLRKRVAALQDGATVLIAAPPNPFRCPPGPYERVSLIAAAMHRRGHRRSKIVIADAKDDFSLRGLYQLEWDKLYPGVIEWIPRAQNGEVVRVDAKTGEVWLRDAAKPLRVDLASVIPAQRAADLARDADLCDESGWAPVDPASFESQRHRKVHVIGDSSIAAPMPKSAFAANSQAKLCAATIAGQLDGAPAPDARLINTCYSLVAEHRGISVSELFGAVDGRMSMLTQGMSPLAGDDALRELEGAETRAWYHGITTDSFGKT